MIHKNKKTQYDKIVEKRKALTRQGKGKAAIWTRVSSEEQYKNNRSIDTQKEACVRFCENNGKQIKYQFGGTFESAKEAGDGFLEMIGIVLNDAEVDEIVVFDYDRFSRNQYEGLTYKGQLSRGGISIKSVNQPLDSDNVLSEHIASILIIIADIDNAMRRHKCHDGMVACINRGEWYSRPPIGYDSKKVGRTHQITVNEKGRLLKLAFDWIIKEPTISQAEIVRRLEVRGLKICKQRLSMCLHNQFYCGRLEHKYLYGKVIKGKQEPLVSEEVFDKVQEILNGSNPHGYEQATETPRFPLKGHVYCLNHALSGYTVKNKNRDYYKYSGKDGSVNVSATELHDKYAALLSAFSVPHEVMLILNMVLKRKFAEKGDAQVQDVANIKKNLATVKAHIATAKKRYAIGAIEKDVYRDVVGELEQDKAKIEGELQKASVNLSNLEKYINVAIAISSNIGDYWNRRDFQTCQKIQKMVFPDGVKWDAENRCYLTEKVNPMFASMHSISANYECDKNKKQDKSLDLSCLVAGVGLEPHDLRVMSPTSYQLLHPAMYR